jgi:hypothetical protein
VRGFLLSKRSPKTRDAYAADLASWLAWCQSIGLDALAAGIHHADVYLRLLAERSDPRSGRTLAPSSIARRTSALHGFYRYAARHGAVAGLSGASDHRPRRGEGAFRPTRGLRQRGSSNADHVADSHLNRTAPRTARRTGPPSLVRRIRGLGYMTGRDVQAGLPQRAVATVSTFSLVPGSRREHRRPERHLLIARCQTAVLASAVAR